MFFTSSALEAALAPADNPSFATATVCARTHGALTVAKGVPVVESRTKESVSSLPYSMSCLVFVDIASLSAKGVLVVSGRTKESVSSLP